jgi:hypothetical protein
LFFIIIVALIGGLAGLAQAIESGFSFRSNKTLVEVVLKMEKEMSEMTKMLVEMEKERLGRHGR